MANAPFYSADTRRVAGAFYGYDRARGNLTDITWANVYTNLSGTGKDRASILVCNASTVSTATIELIITQNEATNPIGGNVLLSAVPLNAPETLTVPWVFILQPGEGIWLKSSGGACAYDVYLDIEV